MFYFNVVSKGTIHYCFLDNKGRVWIKELDGSETSSTRFLVDINSIEVAKKAALEILMLSGR